ncbi:MAG: Ammonia channel precursor, partial [Pseudomonadota bacterium]
MKKLFASLALGMSLCFGGAAFAQTAPAAEAKVEAKAEAKAETATPATAPAPAAAPAAAEAAPALVPNKGDTAWMMVATILVIMMV